MGVVGAVVVLVALQVVAVDEAVSADRNGDGEQ